MMTLETLLNLNLYKNLTNVDFSLDEIFNLKIYKSKELSNYKMELCNYFTQLNRVAQLDIEDNYLSQKDNLCKLYNEIMTTYSNQMLSNLELMKNKKNSKEDLNNIKDFGKIINNIIYNNLDFLEKFYINKNEPEMSKEIER